MIDHPILTRVGIFEYRRPDGSIRRELRLPEEVFAPESLASYKGKPVILTHEAGMIDSDNVQQEQIGTILSEGTQDGDNVRAQIIIHDARKLDYGLRELSLGYSLDLEEVPGEWQGQPYDAIQRNIRVNHLALVEKARAGDSARLNIDGEDTQEEKGGNTMSKRKDGLTPEEIAQLVEEYMFLLAFYVLRENFGGFFGKISALFGNLVKEEGGLGTQNNTVTLTQAGSGN